MTEQREVIARALDPDAFDGRCDLALRTQRQTDAFKDADAILAALSQVGYVVVKQSGYDQAATNNSRAMIAGEGK